MLTGLEGILKYFPLVATIAVTLVSFGELKADIKNLVVIQQQQYQQVHDQISLVQQEINDMHGNTS